MYAVGQIHVPAADRPVERLVLPVATICVGVRRGILGTEVRLHFDDASLGTNSPEIGDQPRTQQLSRDFDCLPPEKGNGQRGCPSNPAHSAAFRDRGRLAFLRGVEGASPSAVVLDLDLPRRGRTGLSAGGACSTGAGVSSRLTTPTMGISRLAEGSLDPRRKRTPPRAEPLLGPPVGWAGS